jgi:hypothetical protein
MKGGKRPDISALLKRSKTEYLRFEIKILYNKKSILKKVR